MLVKNKRGVEHFLTQMYGMKTAFFDRFLFTVIESHEKRNIECVYCVNRNSDFVQFDFFFFIHLEFGFRRVFEVRQFDCVSKWIVCPLFILYTFRIRVQ